MQFDDRLATVLRMQAGSERAVHTQYRQLLDLVGSAPENASDTLLGQAFARLEALASSIDAQQRAAMIREPGMRLRNVELAAFLANQELPVASAAMAAARLSETQWDILIPTLPIPARALLRHRRDLPARTGELLARLGVADLVLPQLPGETAARLPQAAPQRQPSQALAPSFPAQSPAPPPIFAAMPLNSGTADNIGTGDEIGAIVRRIEEFQRARQMAAAIDAPRLPLGELQEDAAPHIPASFDFTTDAEGRIIWADAIFAPMTVGIMLASLQPESPARPDPAMVLAIRRHQPLKAARVTLDGAPAITGEWRIDAAPQFSRPGGRFTGYRGRMRRPNRDVAAATTADSTADRMRQIIHELRTPVNAIQGFAEIIQQQLFGPTPHEYRALAASIAGDAARILAGFEELDRLAKLESNALELEPGNSDLRLIVAATVRQLDSVLRPRSAGLELAAPDGPCSVALEQKDAEVLAWRILATLGGVTMPGEELSLSLKQEDGRATLAIALPAALASRPDIFASAAPSQAQAVTAGMFGAGFTLRLARAEARTAGGDLFQESGTLVLSLPLASADDDFNHNKTMDLAQTIAETA